MNYPELEITIKSDPENDVVRLRMFPFDFLLLEKLLGDSPARINKIHAVVFSDNEGGNDDVFIKDSNFLERMGEVTSIKNIINFFSSQKREYTINKLDIDCEDINVFYDDDALLIISLPLDKARIDISFLKNIVDSIRFKRSV